MPPPLAEYAAALGLVDVLLTVSVVVTVLPGAMGPLAGDLALARRRSANGSTTAQGTLTLLLPGTESPNPAGGAAVMVKLPLLGTAGVAGINKGTGKPCCVPTAPAAAVQVSTAGATNTTPVAGPLQPAGSDTTVKPAGMVVCTVPPAGSATGPLLRQVSVSVCGLLPSTAAGGKLPSACTSPPASTV